MVDGIPQDEDHEDEWLGFRPTLPDFLPVMGHQKITLMYIIHLDIIILGGL